MRSGALIAAFGGREMSAIFNRRQAPLVKFVSGQMCVTVMLGAVHILRNTEWGGGGLPDLLQYYIWAGLPNSLHYYIGGSLEFIIIVQF